MCCFSFFVTKCMRAWCWSFEWRCQWKVHHQHWQTGRWCVCVRVASPLVVQSTMRSQLIRGGLFNSATCVSFSSSCHELCSRLLCSLPVRLLSASTSARWRLLPRLSGLGLRSQRVCHVGKKRLWQRGGGFHKLATILCCCDDCCEVTGRKQGQKLCIYGYLLG